MFCAKNQRWGVAALVAILLPVFLLWPLGGKDTGQSVSYEREVPPRKIKEAVTVFQEEQTYSARLPHETTYCYSDVLPQGAEQVMTEGKDGELRCVARVTYINGKETQREVLRQDVAINPVTEVIAIGTGLRQAGQHTGVTIENGIITLPTGEILTYYDSIQVRATGYTHTDAGCDMITSTGTTVHVGTVAVDPRYVPYGTRMFIVSNDGSYVYGISVAEDCGGAIKGDRMDLYFPTTAECFQFGRRNCTVYLLGGAE